jgi:hypothetical protein
MKLSELTVAPVQVTVPLYLDGGVHDRIQALASELDEAITADDVELARDLAGRIGAETAAAKPVPFVFEQLDPKRWSDLLAEHETGRDDEPLSDAFKTVIVQECLVDPEPDAFDLFWARLNQGQQQQLFGGAWAANQPVAVPFVRAASQISRVLKPSSTTAVNGASPARFSSAGSAPNTPDTSTTEQVVSSGV